MKVRYLGHSSFEIRTQNKTLIVDPFISGNPLAAKINVSSLKADYVLLTHGHGDHVADAVQIAQQNKAMVISSFEVVLWFEKKGIEGHSMNIGGKNEFEFGTLKYVNATHSSTMPDGTAGGHPGGFVLWNDEGCIYIAGDTGLSYDMQLIPMTCPQLSAAILPVGDNFTMGNRDAMLASDFIQCDRIIGCHFDTFDAIKIDHEAATQAFAEKNKELVLLNVGEEISI